MEHLESAVDLLAKNNGTYLAYIHPDNMPAIESLIAKGKARYGEMLADGTIILEIDD